MKRFYRHFIALSTLLCAPFFILSAQPVVDGEQMPDGVVVYSLPSTSLHLEVEAVREYYTPGPYAQYAEKYLGITVSLKEEQKYQLQSIRMTPCIEADQGARYVVNLAANPKYAPVNFFKMSSQGLVILSDDQKGGGDYWRFPTLADQFEIDPNAATENITSTKTTLYKSVKNAAGGYDKVAVQQSQVVEKSLEKKAQEAARTIFDIRKKRVEIVTGDTDATFTGEAMSAVISQMNKIEAEYLSLFIGKHETSTAKMNFDVIPQAANERQLYVAFRISDTQGLLPAEDVSGRPIIVELKVERSPVNQPSKNDAVRAKSGKGMIYYREPAVSLVKVSDGKKLLFQQRVPVYQLGRTMTFPLESMMK